MSIVVEYVREVGRFQRNAQLYLISNVLSGVSSGILLVLYNLYLFSLGYKTDFIGLVLFAGTLGAAIAIFPAGICIDRFGGKIILISTSLIFGIVGAGQILFRQPFPLLVSSFFAGIDLAFFMVVNAPYLTANSTAEERPHLFSLNIVLALGTIVLGELLGGVLPQWFRAIPLLMAPLPSQFAWILATQHEPRSYQLALLFAGLLSIPNLVPLFMLSNDRPPATSRHSRQTSKNMRRSFVQCIHGMSAALSDAGLTWIAHSPFFVLIVVWVLVGLGAGLFAPYFNLYFVQHLKASPALFGFIDGSATAINALLTLVAPLLATRIGKVNTIVLTRLIGVPLLITLGFINSLPLAAALYLFRLGATDMSLGVFQVFSMESVPEQRRGIANSGYQTSDQVSRAIATPLGGLVIAHVGYTPVFMLGALLYLVAIVVFWSRFRGKEGKVKQIERIEQGKNYVVVQKDEHKSSI